MKAVISTTYDDKYLFFLPIVAWCWHKLGVGVVCFMPETNFDENKKASLAIQSIQPHHGEGIGTWIESFKCPPEKEATYAQCSRIYAACLDFTTREILITSDIDMAVFKLPLMCNAVTSKYDFPHFDIVGDDLVPEGQYPICYIAAPAREWRKAMKIEYGATTADMKSEISYKTYTHQEKLDDLLGNIECENMRGNYWGKDQETIFNALQNISPKTFRKRARQGTQFAENRVDRDDINWRSYVTEDLIDAHLWRPGYTDEFFANILELLQTKYPNENFDWLKEYREKYIQLL